MPIGNQYTLTVIWAVSVGTILNAPNLLSYTGLSPQTILPSFGGPNNAFVVSNSNINYATMNFNFQATLANPTITLGTVGASSVSTQSYCTLTINGLYI